MALIASTLAADEFLHLTGIGAALALAAQQVDHAAFIIAGGEFLDRIDVFRAQVLFFAKNSLYILKRQPENLQQQKQYALEIEFQMPFPSCFQSISPDEFLHLTEVAENVINLAGNFFKRHLAWDKNYIFSVNEPEENHMKWIEIKQLYPDKFILINVEKEEKISGNEYRILSGDVIATSTDIKQIMKAYQEEKEKGKNVLYALPSTPYDFIVENVPFMGILR